jgi:hypothetical protein
MSTVLDRDALVSPAARSPEADVSALVSGQQQVVTLLMAILAELQSWRPAPVPPDGPPACTHPEGQRKDMSGMGDKWIRCGACGVDLVRKERA